LVSENWGWHIFVLTLFHEGAMAAKRKKKAAKRRPAKRKVAKRKAAKKKKTVKRKATKRKAAKKKKTTKRKATKKKKATKRKAAKKKVGKKKKKKAAKRKPARKKVAKKKKKKAAKKKPAKKKAAKKKAKKKTKRKPNLAFMRPMTPSAALAAVVGSAAIPRTEVTKKIWAYIKRNGLQDSANRRNINADDKLRPIFSGKSQVSMFEMTKHLNNHLS
jgi:chromatin remodeling complex protein RSC6